MRLKQIELLRILARRECPFCEESKLDGCMYCDKCFAKLPLNIRQKVHNALRSLSEALRAGLNFLEG